MAVVWGFTKQILNEDLFINYFSYANMAGPAFAISMILRRRSRAGTSPLIWITYTLMTMCWFAATALWFGKPFGSPLYLAFGTAVILSGAATTRIVLRMPAVVALSDREGDLPAASQPATGFAPGNASNAALR
jgi:hypothetical protein